MFRLKLRVVWLGLCVGLMAASSVAEELAPAEAYQLAAQVYAGDKKVQKSAADRLIEARDPSVAPGLVDALFFTDRAARGPLVQVLQELTGEDAGSTYMDWVETIGRREDLVPKDGYIEWKRFLYSRVDEEYRKVFYPGAAVRIRLEEIVWGGVPLDGIPVLEQPPTIPAAQAKYLKEKELVFGVVLGGQARAYPRRFLSWHEMLNDTVGGVPITLSYCTLCGSAIVYSTATEEGGARSFGTSGLLYRSNKLMYDRETFTLWSNLTGTPVVGRLAAEPIELEQLPVTLTTWAEWLRRHPSTDVLDLDGVKKAQGRSVRYDYSPGAADRQRRGVEFPVWQSSDALERNAEVYALRVEGVAKAYPMETLAEEPVVNDQIGSVALVLVTDPESGAVRAYERGGETFQQGASADLLTTADGESWRVEENALTLDGGTRTLPRVPGHVAFWFGWYGFYPETELYGRR